MKNFLLIASLSVSITVSAQNSSYNAMESSSELSGNTYLSKNVYGSGFFPGILFEAGETSYLSEGERLNLFNSSNLFLQPSVPFLNTNQSDLEICTGNSTRLTALSNHTIYWYTTPPPLGLPVGTGTSYITPVLTTGYYTYYAIAENDGIKSDITAMEVVMVYPTPVLSISSNANTLCANETATLSVSGTTYYEWENGPVASQMTIRPTRTKEYKVTGINTAGCRMSAVYTQLVEPCNAEEAELNTGDNLVAEKRSEPLSVPVKEEKLFSVYPNPNNGEFHIRVNSISESTRVDIYNGLGALTYSYKVTDEVTAVTLKESPNGIYIVRVIENDKVLKQQKIVKE